MHAVPAGQQIIDAPLPHGVVFLGHPQIPAEALRQGTPALQHDVPHGVWPLQQQVTVAGSEQVSVLLQHPLPQKVMMLGLQPQRPVLGSAQIRPEGQQLSPHGVRPARQAH
ncbi:MAG: hypothetical protein JO148_08505 [Acidimicrobiia bacterium]|nr:hypothetical protein [Acidimicrobiia bacterium]